MNPRLPATILIFLLVLSGPSISGELKSLFEEAHGSIRYLPRVDECTRQEYRENNPGITEIGIEWTYCFGTCPVYTVIFKSDGTATYAGTKFVDKLGDYTGIFRPWRFHRIALFVDAMGYQQMDDFYRENITDLPTSFQYIKQNETTKIILKYGVCGPPSLWVFQELLKDLEAETEWTKVSN